jgi:MtN3 and saliva related transmembrane protein
MSVDMFTWLGIAAGAITSIGFIPQLIRAFKTKHLDDISYWMPLVLAGGMLLWLSYGIFRNDVAIIAANTFGVGCNILLLLMKKRYS